MSSHLLVVSNFGQHEQHPYPMTSGTVSICTDKFEGVRTADCQYNARNQNDTVLEHGRLLGGRAHEQGRGCPNKHHRSQCVRRYMQDHMHPKIPVR